VSKLYVYKNKLNIGIALLIYSSFTPLCALQFYKLIISKFTGRRAACWRLKATLLHGLKGYCFSTKS